MKDELSEHDALKDLLDEGEQKVPSTAPRIIAVLREERERQTAPRLAGMNTSPLKQEPSTSLPKGNTTRSVSRYPGTKVQTALSLVAALLLVISLSLLTRLLLLHPTSSNSSAVTNSSLVRSSTWSSVVITSVQNNQLTIANYDPLTGKNVVLARVENAASVTIDGISHDGYSLLYHVFDGSQTNYMLLTPPMMRVVYSTPGRAGQALWSTDDHTLYISTPGGIEQVNSAVGNATLVWSAMSSPDIRYYRDGYIYIATHQQGTTTSGLQRVHIATGNTQDVVMCANASNFWLSPGGSTVYYTCAAQDVLYAVNSDGTQPRTFRSGVGQVIGYAADGSLLTLITENGVYKVVKLGPAPLLDRVLLDTVAPQATNITPDAVAVAPYGARLVVRGNYGNNLQKVWYGDLLHEQQSLLLTTGNGTQVNVIGWDKLLLPGATPLPQPTVPLPYNEWHNVLMVSSDAKATTIANYDILNGSNTPLTTPKLPLDGTHVDGISHDGSNVLYHLSSSGHTLYYTLTPVARTGFFYALADENVGNANNAIWLPDDRHVLISTANSSVVKVDVQTGQSDTVLPTLKTAGLVIYRAPYLYFIGAEDRVTGALYRVNVDGSNAVPVQVTWSSPNTTFLISPDGATVYFVNNGSVGQAGIYGFKSDGSDVSSNPQPLRVDGVPVGYAADNKLIFVSEVQGKFQLVKLGATPDQDQVLLVDIAPNAVSLCDGTVNTGIVPICDASIALAPLGGALVVEAGYADGSSKVWSIDLQTGARFELATPAGLPNVQLKMIGWDQVAGN